MNEESNNDQQGDDVWRESADTDNKDSGAVVDKLDRLAAAAAKLKQYKAVSNGDGGAGADSGNSRLDALMPSGKGMAALAKLKTGIHGGEESEAADSDRLNSITSMAAIAKLKAGLAKKKGTGFDSGSQEEAHGMDRLNALMAPVPASGGAEEAAAGSDGAGTGAGSAAGMAAIAKLKMAMRNRQAANSAGAAEAVPVAAAHHASSADPAHEYDSVSGGDIELGAHTAAKSEDMDRLDSLLSPGGGGSTALQRLRHNKASLGDDDADGDNEEANLMGQHGGTSGQGQGQQQDGATGEPLWQPDEMSKEFIEMELEASNYNKQLRSISSIYCVVQILIYILMTQQHGFRGSSTSTVSFPDRQLQDNGAASYDTIVGANEWWRLGSSIFVHNGFIDMACNLFIQYMQCGYLGLMYGDIYYTIIYVGSGSFGTILRCIVRKDQLSCGSSAAVMGVFGAWLVWLIYRWRKIPIRYQWLRNAQVGFVLLSIFATLVWAAFRFDDADLIWLTGSACMGFLWGVLLFAYQLSLSRSYRVGLRICVGSIIFSCYVISVARLTDSL